MTGPGGNDDGDETTNIDGSLIDPMSEDTSVGDPPVAPTTTDDDPPIAHAAPPGSRTKTDTDPTGAHAAPPTATTKPPLAVLPAPPSAADPPIATARPPLAVVPAPPSATDRPQVPAPPGERTRTPAPIPPLAPDTARERTRPPAAGIAPPPPPADALRERTRTPAAGRPITPPAPPDAARERTRTPPAGRPITPPATPEDARDRTRTPAAGRPITPPAPPGAARERTRTPAAGRPIAPPAAPDDARERTRTPPAGRPITPSATPDAARERTRTPAAGQPNMPAAQQPPAIARTTLAAPPLPAGADAPPPTIARTKTPGPADGARARAASPALTDLAAPASGARERAASPAPTDSARERTETPAAERPLTPHAEAEPPLVRASSPALADSARERTPVPAPRRTRPATDDDFADPAPMIERATTPAPGRPITPSAADAMAQPRPVRAASPAPTDEALVAPTKRRAATAPPERELTPVPTAPRRAATAPPEREVTPIPTTPRRAATAPPEREVTPQRAASPMLDEGRPAAKKNLRAKTAPPTREVTPLPTAARRSATPLPERELTPVPAAPRRTQRASTNPPTDSLRARSPSNPANGRADDARSVPTASITEREPWLQRIARIAPWVIIALPALFQVFLLSTAITGRLMYPYDLEWMEGGMLHHAQRIHGGLGIYVAPSIEFIPYLYTPLYPSLLALFGGAFGFSYTLGRAFSVLALIGIAVVAAVSIANPRHEHARRAPAYAGVTIALGLFAAAYPFMEGWYDLVRADTLFLFMVTAAIAGLPRWAATGSGIRGHGRVAAGAVLLALAFFCKQTGIIYVAFGGLIVLVVAWRRVPAYVLMAGSIGLGGTWLLQRTTDGWFWIYIQKIHQAHDFNWDRFWKSFENILWQFPAMTMVIAAGLVVVLVTVIWRRKLPRATHPLLLWSSTFAVSTLLGAIGWGTEFAHFNAYMPAFLHGALAAGAAIPAIYGCARSLHGRRNGAEAVSTLLALGAAVPLALACYEHRWDPKKFMPTQRDVAAGDRLIARIRGIEGDVWMPSHPWYLVLAGKSPRAHRMGVKDVTWRQTRTVDGLEAALQHHAFAALILDGTDIHNAEPATSSLVNSTYRAAFRLPENERPRVYTGARVTPDSIWVPAIPAQPPHGTRALFDFEQAAWDGWTLSGSAWGARPETELTGHGLLFGATGRRYATSMHGGDVATGRVTSPSFTLDGKLTIKLGGGTDATKLRVELWVGGAIVATAAVPTPGGETLHTVTIDPGPNRGAPATLVLVDDSPTGHLDVDDVWLTP